MKQLATVSYLENVNSIIHSLGIINCSLFYDFMVHDNNKNMFRLAVCLWKVNNRGNKTVDWGKDPKPN